jgi:hypothetical protein
MLLEKVELVLGNCNFTCNLGSVDGTVRRLQTERPAVWSLTEVWDFSLLQYLQPGSWVQTVFCSVGIGSSFSVVRRKRRMFDHLPTPEAEFEKEWSCSSAPTVCLHGLEMKDFTFTVLRVLFIHAISVTLQWILYSESLSSSQRGICCFDLRMLRILHLLVCSYTVTWSILHSSANITCTLNAFYVLVHRV